MSTPMTFQPSFAKGEISPFLYPRTDISAYQIGLSCLENAIVLPTGGATRRPGLKYVGRPLNNSTSRLIEFVYNSNDAMVIELTNGKARLWSSSGVLAPDASTSFNTPYLGNELNSINYAQSGNVIFVAHKNHPVTMFKRTTNSAGRMTLNIETLDYKNGPWLTDLPDAGIEMRLTDRGRKIVASRSYFNADKHTGKLIELNFATGLQYVTEYLPGTWKDPNDGSEWYISESKEVGGQYHIQTHNNWTGKVILERSYDGGNVWVDAVSMYDRTDPAAQGNWDISRVEDDKNVLYRFRSDKNTIKFTLSISNFTKTYIYKIDSVTDTYTALGTWQKDRYEVSTSVPLDNKTLDWRIGAWGGSDGYPSIVTFFQGRLVLAASNGEPQTIWMSRTNDFADFGTSMEIQDDDAVNISLSSPDADGIVGIEALDDLLVRTASGEWRVKGAGDNGAITPTAIVAHRQGTEIGGAFVRSIITGGGVIFVQTHRKSVYAIGYDLSSDGYRGNELSILSSHIFKNRNIVQVAWQKQPDKILWMVLDDGTLASCTFDPDQQMNAWARHNTDGFVGDIAVIPQNGFDEVWFLVRRDGVWNIERLADRTKENIYTDNGRPYETCLRTLRVNYSGGGTTFHKQKLQARCTIYTYASKSANVSPAGDRSRVKYISWDPEETMTETDIQLDNGYRKDAGIEIWTNKNEPLTILAISPTLTAGG